MTPGDDATIFALATAGLPSAIAVVRLSGSRAGDALQMLAGSLPKPRAATLALLRDADGEPIDRGLCLWFPGPASVTGEDMAEFHIHGGRAVVVRLLTTLADIEGLRHAEAGEFARRAFFNGKLGLDEAEGLADLIAAETETQRRHALAMSEGGLAALIGEWRARLLEAEARVEAIVNFADEGDVDHAEEERARTCAAAVADDISAVLAGPPAERLRDGVRVALAGPPNAGKSTLLNALAGRDAAIVSETAGTTRDVIEAPVVLQGMPFIFVDMAGIREGADPIEREGVRRAMQVLGHADIVLWLGDARECPEGAHIVDAKCDLPGRSNADHASVATVSAITGQGLHELRNWLIFTATTLLPAPDQLTVNARQRGALILVLEHLVAARAAECVLFAEALRLARGELDAVTGRASVEAVLDAVFGRFCIGK